MESQIFCYIPDGILSNAVPVIVNLMHIQWHGFLPKFSIVELTRHLSTTNLLILCYYC